MELKKGPPLPAEASGAPWRFVAQPNFENFVQAAAKFLAPLRDDQVPSGSTPDAAIATPAGLGAGSGEILEASWPRRQAVSLAL